MHFPINPQIRTVLSYQIMATVVIALGVGVIGGLHWGVSALLGGFVSVAAGAAYGVMLSRAGKGSAENALRAMMRAESVKLCVIILSLWLVFSVYGQVVGVGFIGTFIVTTLIFSFAIFIRQK